MPKLAPVTVDFTIDPDSFAALSSALDSAMSRIENVGRLVETLTGEQLPPITLIATNIAPQPDDDDDDDDGGCDRYEDEYDPYDDEYVPSDPANTTTQYELYGGINTGDFWDSFPCSEQTQDSSCCVADDSVCCEVLEQDDSFELVALRSVTDALLDVVEEQDEAIRTLESIIAEILTALRLTAEYFDAPVENGWSWWDAFAKYAQFFTPEQWEFVVQNHNLDAYSFVGRRVGAATAAWTNLAGAGVFRSEFAVEQVDAISDYIGALRDQIDELGGVPVEPFQVVESEARLMAVDV